MDFNKPMFAGDPFDDSNPYFKYKKGERINNGSFGTVSKAELNGIIFAVKKIRVQNLMMKHLKREIDALIKLKGCENIVTYHQIWFRNSEEVALQFSTEDYDFNEDQNKIVVTTKDNSSVSFTPVRIYIVMEYCESNLNNIIDCITYNQRKYYFKQILNGLKSLDAMNIVHRDLKPNNIFIDSNNVVKIGDFGLALHTDSLTSSELTKGRGNSNFRPPEHYDCDEIESKEISGKVDVYSCGLIYYLMCLKRKVNKEFEVIVEVLRRYRMFYREDHNLSIEDRELLSRMLAKDPKNRISINELYEYVHNDTFNKLFNSKLKSQIYSDTTTCIHLQEHDNDNVLTFNVELLCSGEFNRTYKAKYKGTTVTLSQCFAQDEYATLQNKLDQLKSLKVGKLDHVVKYLPNFQLMHMNTIGDIPDSGRFFVMDEIDSTLKSMMDMICYESTRDEKLILMKQISEGIIYLHRNKIFHLNLNPDNIFIIALCNPKIGNITLCNQVKYSKFHWFHFANEEINYVDALMIDKNNHIIADCRADIYSLGLIFTELWFKSKQDKLAAIEAMQYGFYVDGTEKDIRHAKDVKRHVNDRNKAKKKIKNATGKLLQTLLQEMIHILPESRMDTDGLERAINNKKLFRDEDQLLKSANLRNYKETRRLNNELLLFFPPTPMEY